MRKVNLRSILPSFIAFTCAMVFLAWCIELLFVPQWPDYTVFWTAARFAWSEPHVIYNDLAMTLAQNWVSSPNGVRPWAYPPTALLPLMPFAPLPYFWSHPAFTGVSLTLYAWASRNLMADRWRLGLPLLLICEPVVFGAVNGQMTFLLGALVIGALTVLPKRALAAGAMLGVAAALKPQLLILAPLALFAARECRALFAFFSGGLLVVLMSLFLGPGLWLEWYHALPRFMRTVTDLGILDRSITPTGMLWAAEIYGPIQWAVSMLFGVGAVAWVWRVYRFQADPAQRLMALIGGGLLCSPYAMNYELAIIAPAAVIFVLQTRNGGSLTLATASGAVLAAGWQYAPPAALAFILIALVKSFDLDLSLRMKKMTRALEARK